MDMVDASGGGMTMLLYASKWGEADVVRFLLSSGTHISTLQIHDDDSQAPIREREITVAKLH